jgi:predicted transcriptional regulator of viral defense system
MTASTSAPSALPDRLLAEGRHWLTTEEAAALLDREKATLYPRLAELERAGKLFSPAKGLYVVVPPEYRDWGVTPADWFIDPMMRHLGRDYYVSFLSAAARHGAAHQAPQTFQAVVDRQLRDRDLGRVRLRFVKSQAVELASRERMSSHTGMYLVATREMTAVDLAWRPRLGGGISNVATVVRDLGALDGEKLARAAAARGRGTARRLGWLAERFRDDVDTFWLRQIARPAEGAPAVLIPGNQPRGPVDSDWGLRLNGTVEPD